MKLGPILGVCVMGVDIVSAGRGEGKTSFLREYVARMAAEGCSVGGIASPAVFENGERVGYDLLDLRLCTTRPLARVVTSPNDVAAVGVYQFDEQAIKGGNRAIISAVRDGLDAVVVDEVGPLEIRGKGWSPALEVALRECSARQELVITVRPSMVDELPNSFPSPLWATAKCIAPPWPLPLPDRS
ncbi:MAG: nucleoside-triphosphatase [Planctomycetota bacterium]|jgi:nucleoside-triphosphatase THEP1